MVTNNLGNSIVLPGGAACVASFSFDVDGESAAIGADPSLAQSMSTITHQAYGPLVGVTRILDILEKNAVKSTFFVPGYTAERYPHVVKDISTAGHEIAHHGYHHVKPTGLSLIQQADQLDMGLEILEKLSGQRPVGYRAPMWDLSWEMPQLLAERGFLYDSSLMDADLPYHFDLPNVPESKLLEIPIQWTLDDWEQYCFVPGLTELGPIQTPENAISLWRSELEGMRRYGGCWVLTNHPFLSGRPGRALALNDFIAEVVSMNDVWMAPLSEVAEFYSKQEIPRHMVKQITKPGLP